MARAVFWPVLLAGRQLERFCSEHLPETFAQLKLPFAAVATIWPRKEPVSMTDGHLASAISASCAMRVIRRPVVREGQQLKDGGISCVLPAGMCRDLGAEVVIASDVWELSSLLRGIGLDPAAPEARRFFPSHYRQALGDTDVLIHPRIPIAGYIPGPNAIERMIAVGEVAARQALARHREDDGQ